MMDNNINNEKSLKMRNMPIGKLIFSMSMPAIISMLIQALYNIVDTMYVSEYDAGSTNAVTALGYAFVVQMIILAFALGVGIGGNILISRYLGERKKDDASNVAKTIIIMSIIMGLIMFILSFIVPQIFMKSTSGVKIIQDYGIEYLQVIMMFSMFMMVDIALNKMLQGMGRMIIPMICQIVGAIVNIILDPIFISTLGMGIEGAAIATIIGQASSCSIVVIYVLFVKLDISISFKHFKFKWNYLKSIIIAGIPVIVMNSIGAFVNLILFAILRRLDSTETAIGVLSVYYKIQSFIFMPVFGLTQGGLPILSYNYGAKIYDRFKKGLVILYTTSFIVMTIGFIMFQVFPSTLLSILDINDEAIDIGVGAFRIISYCFIPASFGIISITTFQSIGHGNKALMMSLFRQGVFLVPIAFLLSYVVDIKGVWLAYPIAEVLCILMFFPILMAMIKKVFNVSTLKVEERS